MAYRGRTRADAVLAGLVLLASVLEVAFRADLVWRPVAALLGLALAATVLGLV